MLHDPNNIVVVDAETFYSTDFSLTKPQYNTSAYIRSPLFKTHCWAVKVGNRKTRGFKNPADAIKFLQDINWDVYALCAHNTAFDGMILSHYHGIIPHFYYDTLSMTRGLHNEVSRARLDDIAKYYKIGMKSKTYLAPTKGIRDLPPVMLTQLLEGCVLDVDLCYGVMNKQIEIYPEDELHLIDMTMRMFCDPILEVDEELARSTLADEMMERRYVIIQSKVDEKDLMSNPKFAELLKKAGVEPPTKISNANGIETFAFAQTDPEFIELLNHENKKVVLLARGRLAAKSTQAETRAARLLQAGENNCRLPVGYNYFGAKTGRWSGTNRLNLQNLPRVNPKMPRPSDGLRRAIKAPAGHVLVVVDSAQIEARILVWLVDQDDIVELFRQKQDVYSYMAMQIYGKLTVEDVTKDERFVGKVATLGLGFGMGWMKFQTTLALGLMGPAMTISALDSRKVVNLYRGRNHMVAAAWKKLDTMLGQMAAGNSGDIFDGLIQYDKTTIWLPNGMGLHYPNLHYSVDGYKYWANNMWKKIYGGLLIENIVQALARIVVGEQMLLTKLYLDKLKLKKDEHARVVMMTHDEIVACVPERYADKTLENMLKIMRTLPHNWGEGLPLDAEGGYDYCYSK